MAFENTGGLTLIAAAALTRYQRIHVDTNGQWAVSGVTTKADAVAADDYASGAPALGIPLIPGTVVKMIASEALTIGEKVYGAASGKLDDVTTNCLEGKALAAASGDGSIIPVMVMPVSAVTL